ncbi:hypothetical protein [Bacillus ndiopicus]|uniref:hypothetical protein n=1 Tax=Bacillus ndiopicus TaxID=1347368 RepID=UPI0005A6E85F|nr:hypothetical protein [Bacillus ndiopicus]
MAILIEATTDQAVNYVQDNLKRLGEIISVKHSRNSNEIDYETIIKGENATLYIQSGFASGYGGTGPRALVKLLVSFGFDEEEVERLVVLNTDNKFEFELRK